MRFTNTCRISSFLVSCTLADMTWAQTITVKVHRDLSQPTLCPCDSDPNTPEPPCTETYTYNSGADVTIDVFACVDSINIYGGSGVDIGLVTINGSGIGSSNRLEIILGAAAWAGGGYDNDDRQSVAALGDFGGLVFNNSSTRNNSILAGRVAGNLTGNIDIGQISRLDVDGQLDAAVVVGAPSSTSGRMIVETGSISNHGNIELETGTIWRVKVYGDIAAPSSGSYSVTADSGHILLVETDDLNPAGATADLLGGVQSVAERIHEIAIDGNIGSPTVTTKITASNFIQSIEAEAVWADITVETSPGALDGNFWHMDIRSGDFNGSVKAGKINESANDVPDFFIAGDWNADVTLGSDIRTLIDIDGDLSADAQWDIGGALLMQNDGADPYDGEITVGGDLLGTLAFDGSVRGPITITGDLGANAVIDIGARIETETTNNYKGSLTINGRLLGAINIGQQLQGPIWVRNLDNSGAITGLVGHIVINALDDSYGWDDLVSLGDDGAGTPAPLLNIHDAATQPDLAPITNASAPISAAARSGSCRSCSTPPRACPSTTRP